MLGRKACTAAGVLKPSEWSLADNYASPTAPTDETASALHRLLIPETLVFWDLEWLDLDDRTSELFRHEGVPDSTRPRGRRGVQFAMQLGRNPSDELA